MITIYITYKEMIHLHFSVVVKHAYYHHDQHQIHYTVTIYLCFTCTNKHTVHNTSLNSSIALLYFTLFLPVYIFIIIQILIS